MSAEFVSTNDQVKLIDNYGWNVECTPMDELRTVEPVRLVGATFVGTSIDSNFWTATLTYSGTATQANNQIILNNNTTITGGTAVLQSFRTARYIGGSANRYRAQIQLGNTGVVNNVRKWGAYDGTDGAYFKLSGTELAVCTLKGGVESPVASSSWNNNQTIPTVSDVNSYEIYWTNAKVYFVIGGVLKHTASFLTTTWSNTTNLPVRMETINTDINSNNTIMARVSTIYRLGQLKTLPTYKHISGAAYTQCKNSQGSLHQIVINNPATGDISVYDNLSGFFSNVIARVNSANNTQPYNLLFDCPFFNGLMIESLANQDLTIVYE